MFTEC